METQVQRAMQKVTAEARQRKEVLAKLKNENSMGSAQVTAQLAQVNVSGKDLGSLGSVEEINLVEVAPKDLAASPEDEEVEPPPAAPPLSSTSTRPNLPLRASSSAVDEPMMPDPITTTSAVRGTILDAARRATRAALRPRQSRGGEARPPDQATASGRNVAHEAIEPPPHQHGSDAAGKGLRQGM